MYACIGKEKSTRLLEPRRLPTGDPLPHRLATCFFATQADAVYLVVQTLSKTSQAWPIYSNATEMNVSRKCDNALFSLRPLRWNLRPSSVSFFYFLFVLSGLYWLSLIENPFLFIILCIQQCWRRTLSRLSHHALSVLRRFCIWYRPRGGYKLP